MITDSGYQPINVTESNPYDIQYTYETPKGSADDCCGEGCCDHENKK